MICPNSCEVRGGEIMQERKSSSAGLIAIALFAIILIGGFFVAATVELVDCPKCHNNIIFKYLCTKCGGDGKVTILQYLTG